MQVRDLIEQLENMNPEAEVRFANQPSWPFENSIDSVEAVKQAELTLTEKGEEFYEPVADAPEIVYLAEGRQLGYLPGHVSQALGWR